MWEIILGVGIVFLLLEIFLPTLFCINFAIAAFIVAIISLFVGDIAILTIIFCVLSVILIYSLRPTLLKLSKNEKLKTGIEDKYINKIAIATEEITKDKGAISIYDERWQARNLEDGIINKGSNVRIIKNESIVMFVQKID